MILTLKHERQNKIIFLVFTFDILFNFRSVRFSWKNHCYPSPHPRPASTQGKRFTFLNFRKKNNFAFFHECKIYTPCIFFSCSFYILQESLTNDALSRSFKFLFQTRPWLNCINILNERLNFENEMITKNFTNTIAAFVMTWPVWCSTLSAPVVLVLWSFVRRLFFLFLLYPDFSDHFPF